MIEVMMDSHAFPSQQPEVARVPVSHAEALAVSWAVSTAYRTALSALANPDVLQAPLADEISVPALVEVTDMFIGYANRVVLDGTGPGSSAPYFEVSPVVERLLPVVLAQAAAYPPTPQLYEAWMASARDVLAEISSRTAPRHVREALAAHVGSPAPQVLVAIAAGWWAHYEASRVDTVPA